MTALIIALLEHREQHALIRTSLERAGHEVVVVDSFARAKAILQLPPPLKTGMGRKRSGFFKSTLST